MIAPQIVSQIEQACLRIRQTPDPAPTLAALAAEVDLSPGHFQRLFKQVTGVSPKKYADACRVEQLRARLRDRDTVTEAMYEVGYGSSSRLYEQAAGHLGMTPRAYQKGGPDIRIRYTVGRSQLGRVLLAATDKGICAVTLGETEAELESQLQSEFPAATRIRADAELRDWLQTLLDHLAGQLPHPDLPLDVRGTAFQRQVWEALRQIPAGTTKTYAEVAAAIGRPRAVRAVARACATNPVSILTPCHRVIGSDGSMRGYRWGVERKKRLLEQEKQNPGSGT